MGILWEFSVNLLHSYFSITKQLQFKKLPFSYVTTEKVHQSFQQQLSLTSLLLPSPSHLSCLIHAALWQKLTQFYKAIIFQLKNK